MKPGSVKIKPFPTFLFQDILISMHTFIWNVNGVLVIIVTHTWSFYGKESHLFIFAQSALNYSILNKGWRINLSLCDKFIIDFKPLESSLQILTHVDSLLPYGVLYSVKEKQKWQMNEFILLCCCIENHVILFVSQTKIFKTLTITSLIAFT